MSRANFPARPGREAQTWGEVYCTIFGAQIEPVPARARTKLLTARANRWLKV